MRWWADKSIEIVEIDGEHYALHGWNGELYTDCWKCTGDRLMDASKQKYVIQELQEEVEEEQWETVGYKVHYFNTSTQDK